MTLLVGIDREAGEVLVLNHLGEDEACHDRTRLTFAELNLMLERTYRAIGIVRN